MIQLARLITGEEIVADIEDNEDGTHKFKNPVRVMVTQEGIGMGHFSPFAKSKEITVKEEHIVWMAELEDEMRNAYSGQFGSGIVVPQTEVPQDLKIVGTE